MLKIDRHPNKQKKLTIPTHTNKKVYPNRIKVDQTPAQVSFLCVLLCVPYFLAPARNRLFKKQINNVWLTNVKCTIIPFICSKKIPFLIFMIVQPSKIQPLFAIKRDNIQHNLVLIFAIVWTFILKWDIYTEMEH